jgi:membrane fusion protein (multidrug efflux system)
MQRARTLLEKQAAAPAQLQEAEAAYRVAGGQVSALEAQLAQKIVSAPFAGRLGIRAVTLGQYLQVGTGITELDAIGEVFVDFTLPQEELTVVSVGMPVRVALREGRAGTIDGRIVAIDPTVDAATRSLGLRAQIVDPDERLRPGMFVDVAVVLPQQQEVVAVPATAIVHAAYGDSVFVLEEK